jgi:hypothetical protein
MTSTLADVDPPTNYLTLPCTVNAYSFCYIDIPGFNFFSYEFISAFFSYHFICGNLSISFEVAEYRERSCKIF